MFDAVVLAGGGGRRLGGVDKAALRLDGRTLLDRALTAVSGAGRTVVVGPPRELPPQVMQIREDPPGGGPAAALGAGLTLISADILVLLACDLAFVDDALVSRLLEALDEAPEASDGIALVDARGRLQPLLAAYRRTRLRSAVDEARAATGTLEGTRMFAVVDRLRMLGITAEGDETLDCDTWADVEVARRRLRAARDAPQQHAEEDSCR